MGKIKYLSGWRKRDARMERDAIALWNAHGVLPAGVTPEDRAREICCLAHDGSRLAGISTVDIQPYRPLLNKRFGFARVFTSPEYEQQEIAIGLATECRRILEEWSVANPQEELHGMAAVYQSPKLGRYPVGKSGLTLVGLTPEGYQIRIAWFNHLPLY
ncbi:hypothetical protein [Parvibaculum sp.]|uniref:hypothetical protein n=1 Tax=Parvibaculum sp. TaxID=2024848 RepID=UPI00391AA115